MIDKIESIEVANIIIPGYYYDEYFEEAFSKLSLPPARFGPSSFFKHSRLGSVFP
jgi:hypothetical protein